MEATDTSAKSVLFLKPSGRVYYAALLLLFLALTVVNIYLFISHVIQFSLFAKIEFFLVLGTALAFILVLVYFQTAYIKVEEDSLTVGRGILVRTSTMIPFNRIDNIQTSASIIDTLFGLQTVMIDTSGTDQIEVIMPYMPREKVKEFVACFERWKRKAERHGD